jgi:geranylgeranyl pyrophosphate synthase
MKEEEIPYTPLKEATDFFMSSWEDVVHPALLSLACEAVGGKPEDTIKVGAAFVLLAGGADLHDDIIDESPLKDSKPTTYGKFGKELTILAGDALLFKGLYVLHEAVAELASEQREAVLDLTKKAFFRISSAEAKETSLRKKTDVSNDYLDMIKLKSAVSDASTRVGAILGKGEIDEIEVMGGFGRSFGILYTLRDEFIDVLDFKELSVRNCKECLPLPVQLALKEPIVGEAVSKMVAKKHLTKKNAESLFDLVIDTKAAVALKIEMADIIKKTNNGIENSKLQNKKIFKLLLDSMIEDL